MISMYVRSILFLSGFFLLSNHTIPATVQAEKWQSSTIESGRSFSTPSLHMADGGAEWIAYAGGGISHGGDCLYAAHRPADGPWSSQAVDCSTNASFFHAPSLDLDSDGNPQICYVDNNGGHLKYASYNGVEWTVSIVSSTSMVEQCSLTMASDNSPVMAFTTQTIVSQDPLTTSPNLLLAKRNDNVWSFESLSLPTENPIGAIALKLTDTDQPIIVYTTTPTESDSTFVFYALRYVGSSWQMAMFETVATSSEVSHNLSLALNDLGHPLVSYYHPVLKDLKLAWFNGITWQNRTIDELGDVGEYSSIAVYNLDRPVIAYYDKTNNNIKTATFFPDFASEYDRANLLTFTSGGRSAGPHSMVLVSGNVPRLAYFDSMNGTMAHRLYNGMIWTNETIDQSSGYGFGSSMVIDKKEKPHISYFDTEGNYLKYAHWDGSSWNIENITSVGHSSRYHQSSLQLDSQGSPRVLFIDPESRHLLLAVKQPTGSWDVTTIAAEETSGISLVIDNQDRSHFSYFRYSDGSLRLHSYDESGLPFSIPIPGAIYTYTQLILDASDNPALCYYDSSTNELIYYNKTEAGWSRSKVLSSDLISSISLAKDKLHRPHIAYLRSIVTREGTSFNLFYTAKLGEEWSPVNEVATDFWINTGGHLAIDQRNLPVIFYPQLTASSSEILSSMKFIRRDGKWQATTFGEENISFTSYTNMPLHFLTLSHHSSMALDKQGCPHIATPLVLKGDLGYFKGSRCTPSIWPLFIPATSNLGNRQPE